MTALRHHPPALDDAADRLRVLPFRGLLFDAGRVSSLAGVTSPPYDVVDPVTQRELETEDPHNIVRLILPRDDDGEPEGRYERAARRLRMWTADGTLVHDAVPALYGYEQRSMSRVQRGLIATVSLRDRDDGVILPHEDVMPGLVNDRVDLMRATRANLEPILMVYDGGRVDDGGGKTEAILVRASAQPPVIDIVTRDGVQHRVWSITAAPEVATIAADLAPRQVMIADGHHRYAAYLQLRHEQRESADAGSWDTGLALLVDATANPLEVRAIHRAVAGIKLDDGVDAASGSFRTRPLARWETEPALAALEEAGREGTAFLVTDGERACLLDRPDPALVATASPGEHSALWRSLDTAVLHGLLIDAIWSRDESSVTYHHEVAPAVAAARLSNGIAVLLNPVPASLVRTLAARGETMPRKTTSFGPKPRSGLVLRSVDGG